MSVHATRVSTQLRRLAADLTALWWGLRPRGWGAPGSPLCGWSRTSGSGVSAGSEGSSWSSAHSSSGRSVWPRWTWTAGRTRAPAGTRPGPGSCWGAERRRAGGRLCSPLCNRLRSLEGRRAEIWWVDELMWRSPSCSVYLDPMLTFDWSGREFSEEAHGHF